MAAVVCDTHVSTATLHQEVHSHWLLALFVLSLLLHNISLEWIYSKEPENERICRITGFNRCQVEDEPFPPARAPDLWGPQLQLIQLLLKVAK
jgi:hypothetical protein